MESQKFPSVTVLVITLEVIGMKKFVSELRGKTVMTNEGQILGMIENFVVDTVTGEDRKSTRLNSSHTDISRMPSSA